MQNEKIHPSAWDILAAIMGALFLMSGADGQQHVQAMFLAVAGACLVAGRFAPAIRGWLAAWLHSHPQARTFLHSGAPFWH